MPRDRSRGGGGGWLSGRVPRLAEQPACEAGAALGDGAAFLRAFPALGEVHPPPTPLAPAAPPRLAACGARNVNLCRPLLSAPPGNQPSRLAAPAPEVVIGASPALAGKPKQGKLAGKRIDIYIYIIFFFQRDFSMCVVIKGRRAFVNAGGALCRRVGLSAGRKPHSTCELRGCKEKAAMRLVWRSPVVSFWCFRSF